jgi:hypothetical protein
MSRRNRGRQNWSQLQLPFMSNEHNGSCSWAKTNLYAEATLH